MGPTSVRRRRRGSVRAPELGAGGGAGEEGEALDILGPPLPWQEGPWIQVEGGAWYPASRGRPCPGLHSDLGRRWRVVARAGAGVGLCAYPTLTSLRSSFPSWLPSLHQAEEEGRVCMCPTHSFLTIVALRPGPSSSLALSVDHFPLSQGLVSADPSCPTLVWPWAHPFPWIPWCLLP